jgi:hypothetical protein
MTETPKPRRPDDDVPAGFMRTPTGDLRPVELVSEIDMMRDAVVLDLIDEAKAMAARLAAFKRNTYDTIHAFAAISAAKYGTEWGGKKGNITLTSFDGRYQVRLASADRITFDERLQFAKTLIDEYLTEQASTAEPVIQAVVRDVFQTDKEGTLNVGRILGLRKYDVTDPRWQQAMQAITDGIQIIGSKNYVRFYERIKGTDEYQAISLDIASI